VDGDGSIGLAVFSAGIAAVAAGIAVWRSVLAGRQAREARKSRELNAVIALFEAHQSEDAGHLRRLLRNHAIGDHLDDPELRIHLRLRQPPQLHRHPAGPGAAGRGAGPGPVL
jgi:hypothetical protein